MQWKIIKSGEYQSTWVVRLNIEGEEEEEEGKLRSRDIGENRQELSIFLLIRQEQKYQNTIYEEFNL